MPIHTQLLGGKTEFLQLIYDHIYRRWKKEKSGYLTKITKLRSGSKERSDKLPKITQLKCGSLGKSGNVPKST